MLYILLIIGALATAIYYYQRWRNAPKALRKKQARQFLLWLLLALILILVVTGRAHWLTAAFAALLAVAGRLLGLVQYIPILRSVFAKQQQQASDNSKNATGAMSRAQAAAILGVAETATEQEVIEAHKRLMQKLHPDRGGTDALAAQLNQAKEVLLA